MSEKFYLGRIFDPQSGKTAADPLLYDPDDLTTHAVVVGMTGSGKTGLCVDLLEEAALQGIPALMIDPKGDITNLLLHFPDLLPADFQPWVNADAARREGKTVAQVAQETANLWRSGLAKWDITPDRLRALQNSAEFAVYTPGSDAGIPVSILSSLQAPPIPWEENRELLREKISGTVTALLGLVGLTDVDPVRSREHILLSNIFEHAWSRGKDLDLGELIMQVQNPPFPKLGVFDVETFYPGKERFELAMLLNNIMASPAFQAWIEGQPLDINALLYAPDGRPRHSVFYIAHLSEAERMFFVTLLYSAVETWMRTQPGTTTLRALVYFDEIFGYLPPTANPPSKILMLRMLKQARAFGVGQVLVTQNPVDVDYKALSNAGTWFIGKLQTDRDKERLLDGLQSAASGMDRREYDSLISRLGKRVFLVHNVHEKHPLLFQTRWAMNYLAGPLTRLQLKALNALAGAGEIRETPGGRPLPKAAAASRRESAPPQTGGTPFGAAAASQRVSSPETASAPDLPGTESRPAVPARTVEYFLPNNLTLSQAAKAAGRTLPADAKAVGMLYRPTLLAQAEVRFLQRKYNLDYESVQAALVLEPDPRGVVRWDDWLVEPLDERHFDRRPLPGARFASLEAPLNDARTLKSLQADFKDWIYRTATVNVRANQNLKVYAGPQVSSAEFREMCAKAARSKRDAELDKIAARYDRKIATLRTRLAREERELREDESELSQRKMEEWGTHAENLLGLFGGRRRRLSTSLSKRRMTEKAKADVEESIEAIADYKQQIADLEAEKAQAIRDINDKWAELVGDVSEIPVTPYKKDILVTLFGVAWMPYHLVEAGGRLMELPGYGGA
ncbi:MAG TPA: ATP-binding protein [Chloroflexi bacterium]|nr:ATP-binding protein [Chloroflexota bacterium]